MPLWPSTRRLNRYTSNTRGLRVCVQCCEQGGCQWCHQLFASVQVCSVLESLEQEYRRDEDWCGSHDKLGMSAESDHLLPLISKHLEQKEAFLKVIMSQNRLMCFSTESEENKCRINYETEKNVHLDFISKLHEGLYTILRDEMLKDDGEIKIRQDEWWQPLDSSSRHLTKMKW